MRLRRIALWLSGGLLLLLVAGFFWLWFGDPGVFKPQLERLVAEKTGREFVIDGRLEVNVGRETVIVAEGIRFGNAEWAESGRMVEVGYVELRVDTFSLFSAPLTIELVDIDDAMIRLERPSAGDPNWDVLPPSDDTVAEPDDENGVLDVIVRKIDVDNTQVVYESPERTGPLDLRITTLRQQHRDDGFLELKLDAQLNDRAIDIGAVAGTWEALLEAENVEYEFAGQLDTFHISSKGTIDDLVHPRRPALTFAASGPDINDLLRLLKIEEGGKGNIDLRGSLAPDESGPMILDVAGRLGQLNIDASGSLSDLHSLEQFDVTLRASSPNLSRILALFGFEGAREAPFTLDLDASRQDRVLEVETAHLEFAGAEFDIRARLPGFPSLDDGNARIDIKGSDFARLRELLQLPGAASGPFSLGLELLSDDKSEETLGIALTSTLFNIEANGRVVPDAGYVGSDLNFTLTSDNLARAGEVHGLAALPDLPITVRGSFAVERGAIRFRGPVTADIDGNRLQIEGLLALAPRLEGSRLSFGLDAPDLARLIGYFAATEAVPPLPVDMTGEVTLQGSGFRFNKVRGKLGQSSIDVEGILKLAPQLAGSRFTLDSSGPAFEELAAHIPQFDPQPGVFELSGALAFEPDRVRLDGMKLTRPRGLLKGDLAVGLSQPAALIDFDIDARGRSLRSIVTLLGDFEFDDVPFAMAARGSLRDSQLVLDRFDVEAGQATVEAEGELDLRLAGRSTAFEFDLEVPSLARLGQMKQRRLREQALTISARVSGNRNAVQVDDFTVRLGQSDLRGSLLVESGDVPRVSIELQSELIQVAPLLEETDFEYEKEPRFEDGRLIPDIEMPFDTMRKLDGTVALNIKELRRDSLLLKDINVNAELRDGALHVYDARLEARDGWFRARGALEPAEGAGKAMLAARARGLRLGLVEQGTGPTTNADIELNLEATGTDLRSLAGSANGVLYLDMREFDIPKNRFLKRLYGDMLNEILATINPFRKSETDTRVDCVILPVEINDGRLGMSPEALVRTEKIRIVSAASIDLKTEKIEMTLRTMPRTGLTISAGEILNPYVMVIGTLAAPRLAVDAKGSLISGGAAVATGGLSILAKATWERLARSKDPCETAAQQGIEALQDRFPDLQGATAAPQ